jgi:hypothetical protein
MHSGPPCLDDSCDSAPRGNPHTCRKRQLPRFHIVRPDGQLAINAMTLSGVIRRVSAGAQRNGGRRSLRIGTFEGRRSRLRRTREGYGCSIDGKSRGVANPGPRITSGAAVDRSWPREIGPGPARQHEHWAFLPTAAVSGHTSDVRAEASRSFADGCPL